ncbi:MAG: helix-turn-helix domain-containing protein [Sphaerospermopsis kisseleviana]
MTRSELNSNGYVKQRESQILEFKQSFRYGDSLVEYSRSLVGMANNQGGSIVFGIKDKPHEVVGLDERFENSDPRDLNKILLEYFSEDIYWKSETEELASKRIEFIHVKPALARPVVCIKNNQKKNLREGAIYYRYRGETKEIRHSELLALLQAEREKEKQLWMKHIQSIASIGPHSVQILDTYRGEMQLGGAKVLIDKNLVGQLNIVREGFFTEKEGAPTLKLVGELEGLVDHNHVITTEIFYPHTQSTILEKLPISQYEFQACIWKLGFKGDPKFHLSIQTGKIGSVQKYTEQALRVLRETIRAKPDFIENAKREYKTHRK